MTQKEVVEEIAAAWREQGASEERIAEWLEHQKPALDAEEARTASVLTNELALPT